MVEVEPVLVVVEVLWVEVLVVVTKVVVVDPPEQGRHCEYQGLE